jgi:hypothetical protein
MAQTDAEDIEACIREGRRPRATGPYRVQVGDAMFRFQPIVLQDAVHTGHSFLELAGLHPCEQHVLFAVLSDGLLEEIRLEEALDLREGVEKMLAFRSDRIFRLLIGGAEFHWGGAFITGATVRKLAKGEAAASVWLLDGGQERRVGDSELIDLSQPGVETFDVRPS